MSPSSFAMAFPVIELERYMSEEEQAHSKNEYFYGHVYGMSGGSNSHAALSGSVYFELKRLLAGSNGFARNSDFRIETPGSNAVFYPDASVHCNQHIEPTALNGKSPSIIVEVLSPSTRKYDLTTKRKEYFLIPALQYYLLLDSQAVEATLYFRDPSQTWCEEPERFCSLTESIPLPALKIQLGMQELYLESGLLA